MGAEGLHDVLEEVNDRMKPILRHDPGAAPWLVLLQRHYPSQRAHPIMDAKLEFDLRTAFESRSKGSKVKLQEQWLDAALEAFLAKRSNIQLGVGTMFPYRQSRTVGTADVLDLVADSWIACEPLLRAALRS